MGDPRRVPGRPRSGCRLPRLLVVGNGMATDRLLEELARRGALASFAVTVVGEEPGVAYNRMLLAHVLAGAPPEELSTRDPGWYAQHGVRLVAGRWVQRLDTGARRAEIGDGRSLGYDVAVLATGSRALVPPLAGIRQSDGGLVRGVHTFRTMEDVLALRAEADPTGPTRQVVVIGAGLLGLEAAKVLGDLGHQVSVVHPSPILCNAQVDELGGTFLRRAVEELGIEVVIGRASAALCRTEGVEALLLADGRVLPADTLVLTTGVRPRTETAVASGIAVDRGIVVDDQLATSAPGVNAIGECAEHDGRVVGLVAPCWDQAAVLAARLSGTDPGASYRPAPSFTRLKVAGVEVAAMGLVEAGEHDEVVQTIEERRGVYRKLVIRDGRLAGAVLVGDPDHGASLIRVLERSESLPPNRLELLCSGDFLAAGPASPELCSCNRVSEPAVLEAIAAGSSTVGEVGEATRAGTGCGSCVGQIRRLLAAAPACSVA